MPKKFDCREEGFDKGRPVKQWIAQGVKRVKGEIAESFTYAEFLHSDPAGTKGPAFLVFDNFLVIKKYNQSNLYALFVGHLADRLKKNKNFHKKWPALRTYSRLKIYKMQKKALSDGIRCR